MQTKAPSLLVTILTAIFVISKITGHLDWSWWWILSPIWISAGLGLIAAAIFFAIAVWSAS